MDGLFGKTLVVLGDSLIQGGNLPKEDTWVNRMVHYGMTVYNHGINGNTVAMCKNAGSTPMCVRYAEMEAADYVVVLGGANDRNYGVPVGEIDSTDPYTFSGAVRQLILGLTKKYPHAKILFMTNYHRWDEPNANGLYELDYVRAMEEVCCRYSIPCYNNYYECGLSFFLPAHSDWIDEGVVAGRGPNRHFSKAAYTWLLPKYAKLIASL